LEVRVSNTPARNLYEKLGFQNMGVRKNFYEQPKEDAIIYTKYLGESK
jgi:ribosomal-protein-alanine N-acetyltransferase